MPEPGELTDADRAVLAELEAGFETVGGLLERASFKAALGEAMALATRVNQYVSEAGALGAGQGATASGPARSSSSRCARSTR